MALVSLSCPNVMNLRWDLFRNKQLSSSPPLFFLSPDHYNQTLDARLVGILCSIVD